VAEELLFNNFMDLEIEKYGGHPPAHVVNISGYK
jgi:hypothetical protein